MSSIAACLACRSTLSPKACRTIADTPAIAVTEIIAGTPVSRPRGGRGTGGVK